MKNTLLLSAAALSLALAGPAYAQVNNSGEDALEDVVVATGTRASVEKAVATKRDSSGVVDALVSEDIGDFPDLNIADALQRLPGVSLSRETGASEGQRISVRALPSQFTSVTLNGNPVLTASQNGRQVELDVFAAELFNGATLSKTPEARFIEGGLAATLDLQTAKPFDYDGLKIAGTAKGVYNEESESLNPRVSGLASNTWGDWGVLVAGSYSEDEFREDKIENIFFRVLDFETPGGDVVTRESPFLPRTLLERRERERIGLSGAIQYSPNDNFEWNLSGQYSNFDDLRSRNSIDTAIFATPNRTILSETTVPGIGGLPRLVTADLDNIITRSENVYDAIDDELIILSSDVTFGLGDGWSANAAISHTDATTREDLFRILYSFTGEASIGETQFDGVTVPTFQSNEFSFTDPDDFDFNELRFLVNDREATETSVKFDLTKDIEDSVVTKVRYGARFSDASHSTDAFDENIREDAATGFLAPDFSLVSELNEGLFGEDDPVPGAPADFLFSPLNLFLEQASANGFLAADFEPAQSANGSFEIDETTYAAYGQVDFNVDGFAGFDGLRGNAGVRYVRTEQTSTGGAVIDGETVTLVADQTYTDILPSFNLALDINDNLVGRFAASRAISRPNVNQLSPGLSGLNIGLQSVNSGNPELDPFRVNQLDLGLEYYFGENKTNVIGGTFFYKDIESFIETVPVQRIVAFPGPVINDGGVDISGLPFSVNTPSNGEGLEVFGFELFYTQQFSFLPGAGLTVNYTYADGEQLSTFNGVVVEDFLDGAPQSSLNTIGFYETDKFSLRAAYSWSDSVVVGRRGDIDSNIVNDARGQLDFSSEYSVNDNIDLTFEALNVTKTRSDIVASIDRDIGVFGGGRILLFGARFNY